MDHLTMSTEFDDQAVTIIYYYYYCIYHYKCTVHHCVILWRFI